jgi:putative glutamine amidotransferase
MSRPVIGISTYLEDDVLCGWEFVAVKLPRSYSLAVQRAGGLALMAPPDERWIEDPDELLDRLDALILAGGADMDPDLYGAEPHPESKPTSRLRDEVEIALARRALERDLPVLGICRGIEVMTVASGGTLRQHLPDVLGHDRHRRAPAGYNAHEVRLEPGSLAARAAGEEQHRVCSWHHQGPDRLGEGFVPTGWALLDDSVEAVEAPEHRYALGVLWHPEEDDSSPVIASLVEEARSPAGVR